MTEPSTVNMFEHWTVGLSFLNSMPVAEVEELLHHIVDDLQGKGPNFNAIYGISPGDNQFNKMLTACRRTFQGCAFPKIDADNLTQTLVNCNIKNEIVSVFCSVAIAREDGIRESVIESSAQISGCYLADFDWKVNVILSSDKLSTMRQGRVLVNFYLVDVTKGARTVLIEMSDKELEEIISVLGDANNCAASVKLSL